MFLVLVVDALRSCKIEWLIIFFVKMVFEDVNCVDINSILSQTVVFVFLFAVEWWQDNTSWHNYDLHMFRLLRYVQRSQLSITGMLLFNSIVHRLARVQPNQFLGLRLNLIMAKQRRHLSGLSVLRQDDPLSRKSWQALQWQWLQFQKDRWS